MEDKELIRLFYNVRKAQKEYFKRKQPDALQKSIKLEKEADQELELRFNSLFSTGTQ